MTDSSCHRQSSPVEACSLNLDAPHQAIVEEKTSRNSDKRKEGGNHDSAIASSSTSSNGEGNVPLKTSESRAQIPVGNHTSEESGDTNELSPLTTESSSPQPNETEDGDQLTSRWLQWYNPYRNICGKIVNNTSFQLGIVGLILVNALMSKFA